MAMRFLFKPLFFMAFVIATPVYGEAAVTADSDVRYQQALQFAQQGRLSDALSILDALTTAFPENKRYFYDYIAVLGWSENDAEVIRLAAIIDFSDTPSYVLEVIGKSARNRRNYSLALNAYAFALARDSNRVQSISGFTYALAENGNLESAREFLNHQMREQPNNVNLLLTRAHLEKIVADHFSLLRTYEQILAIDPKNQAALAGRVWAASWLGAAPIALDLAKQNRELFTDEEFSRLEADQLGVTIRYATLSSVEPSSSTARLIETRQSLIERRNHLVENRRANTAFYWQTVSDLVIVSSQLDQFQDVIELYQQLTANTKEITPYHHTLAAEAYIQLHQPKTAEAIYRDVISAKPDFLSAHLGLFYALAEQNRYDEGEQILIDAKRTFNAEPIKKWMSDAQQQQLDISIAQANSFADRFDEAEKFLGNMVNEAPANADLRVELATVYLWRGWPYRANDEFNIALIYDPNHFGARIGKIQALMSIHDNETGNELIAEEQQRYPYNARVLKLREEFDLQHSWDLHIDAAYTKSTSPLDNAANTGVNGKLYAPSFYSRYRPFVHSWLAQANLPEGAFFVQRNGIGLNYRRRAWIAEIEFNARINSPYRPGVTASTEWRFDDHWLFDATIETESQSVPLRAQNAGIHGSDINLGMNYRWNESANAGANTHFARYSDTNIRTNGDVYGIYRLFNRYNYKLDGRVDLYGSRNRTIDAFYFNPRWDISSGVSLINEHLLYRFYQHSYRHRLTLSTSAYKQADFSLSPVWSARYEHQWNPNPKFELRVGGSIGRPVFDGHSETNWSLFAGLEARF